MLTRFYTLFDIKTQYYLPPFTAHNDGDAARQIQMILRKGNNIYAQYPEDYNLYEVGSFDDSTGKINAAPNVRIVCGLSKLVERKKTNEERLANSKNNTSSTQDTPEQKGQRKK